MSLLLAIDPGASPSRPGCEARGCRSTSTTSARAYLGQIHPTTIRVCETHRRALEVAGELENPVNCLIPECGRTRATPSRLCAEHTAIVVAAKIRIPKSGVIGAETLVAIRKAIEAVDLQQASTAAVASARPRMEEPAPDYLGRCWEHLRDLVAGGTRIDQAVEEVVGQLKRARKDLAQGEKDLRRVVDIAELRGDEVRAASAALEALGVPAPEDGGEAPRFDLVPRIKRLAMRPTVQPEPVPAGVLQPEAIGGQQLAADLIMAALNGRLAEMPAGVELSLQLALTGVVAVVASERGAVAQRDALEQTIQTISQELDNDGAPEIDGKRVKAVADRVGALIGRWQDEIRNTICAVVPVPDRIDGGACDSGDPLDLTLAEVAQGLTQLQEQIDEQKATPPTPAVQADPLRVQAAPADAVRIAVEWALDGAKAPRHDLLVERIRMLGAQHNQLLVDLAESQARATAREQELLGHLDAVREALKAAQTDPLAPAVKALVAWLNLPIGAAFLEQMIRAVAERTVTPSDAIRALRSEEAMARIILSTPDPFGVPF